MTTLMTLILSAGHSPCGSHRRQQVRHCGAAVLAVLGLRIVRRTLLRVRGGG
jgi:hypothetical protein